jgi:hypothetical protein
MSDDDALELSLQQILDGADGPMRVLQVRDFLDGYDAEGPRPRRDVAEFCSYVRQGQTMNLKPWEQPPCHSDGTGSDPASMLVRTLVRAGVSKFHPDPMKALAEAQRT